MRILSHVLPTTTFAEGFTSNIEGRLRSALVGVLGLLLVALLFANGPAYGQRQAARVPSTEHTPSTEHGELASIIEATLSQAETLPPEHALPALRTVISVRLQGATLEEALRYIAEAASLRLVYGSRTVAVGRQVTLDLEEVTAREALEHTLHGTGLGLLVLAGGQVVITQQPEGRPLRAAPEPLRFSKLVPAREGPRRRQTGTIAGTVVDSTTGVALPGVNVVIAGTQRGASTDAQGRFAISGLEAGPYALVASFIGYAAKRVEGIQVTASDTTFVDIALSRTRVGLDEVVVVGYGERQRVDLTGSVSSISAEEVEAAPNTSVAQMLRGRVAGVRVTQTSHAPGGGFTVRIRGTNSLRGGNEPLYVVDGVPVYNLNGPSISPSNVESITVLKDASATAIYGARGANGVVLITTKQGQAGQTNVSFETSIGMQYVRKTLPLLNATQYAHLTNEAYTNAGEEPVFTEEEIASFGEGTNWQEELFRSAPMQNYHLSVSGGNERITYALSGSYFDQEGIIVGSGFRRTSLRVNLEGALSDRLTVGNHLTINHSMHDEVRTDGAASLTRWALLFSPIQSVYQEDGTYVFDNKRGGLMGNPVAEAKELNIKRSVSRALGNVYAEYQLTEGLTARISLGADAAYNRRRYYAPSFIYAGAGANGEARINSGLDLTVINENTLTYNTTLGRRHALELLAGYTLQYSQQENVFAATQDFPTDKLEFNNLGAGSTISSAGSGASSWGLISYLGRANYVFDDTYLFTATFRVDGSSRFGEGNQYGFFPSGAFAWRLSNEKFIQDMDLFSNLKLRVSYGITGNQQIPVYRSLAALGTTQYILGGNLNVGFAPTRIENPDLKWETTRQFDVGLDVGFLQDRLSITADYYYKVTDDLLLNVRLPYTSGFGTSLQNVGSVQNQGVELAVDVQDFSGAFTWNVGLNFSANRNEVLDLGEREEFFAGGSSGHLKVSTTNVIREGEPIGAFYGYIADGIWQMDEVEKAATYGAEPGEWKYRDLNSDGQITAEDRTITGYPQPDFIGGLSGRVAYRGFEVSVFLQGTYGNDILNMNRLELFTVDGSRNNRVAVMDHWTPENPSHTIPRAYHIGGAGGSYKLSTFHVEDGSYLRLKDVTLAYNLPADLLQWAGLQHVRLYASMQNLLTFTGYSGYDPEVSTYGQATLAQGHDYGAYPSTKIYTVGLSLDF